jgi:hypothetical protein
VWVFPVYQRVACVVALPASGPSSASPFLVTRASYAVLCVLLARRVAARHRLATVPLPAVAVTIVVSSDALRAAVGAPLRREVPAGLEAVMARAFCSQTLLFLRMCSSSAVQALVRAPRSLVPPRSSLLASPRA